MQFINSRTIKTDQQTLYAISLDSFLHKIQLHHLCQTCQALSFAVFTGFSLSFGGNSLELFLFVTSACECYSTLLE